MLPDVWDTILSPLRGLVILLSPLPTAYAVGCILPPLRGCVVADEGVRGELVRAANPPVSRTCPSREPVRAAKLSTCVLCADPSTSDCLDEVNESAVTGVTNVAIQLQIGNRNCPPAPRHAATAF